MNARVELSDGETVEGVNRVGVEDRPLEDRIRLTRERDRMRTRAARRAYLHTDGPGYRVVWADEIEDVEAYIREELE